MSSVLAFLKLKAVRWTLASLAGVVIAAFVTLYAVSSWILSTEYDATPVALRLDTPASPERGARMAAVVGCIDCHRSHGRIMVSVPFVGSIVAPDLARTQSTYTDAELIALIRRGVKRDGTSLIEMPANALSSLADSDLADIIAWLRALQQDAQTESARTSLGPILRFLLLTGTVRISARDALDPAPPASAPQEQIPRGTYLVKVACMNCHLLEMPQNLGPGRTAPGLRDVVPAYDHVQFARLLRTGKALGDREVGLMSEVARTSFVHMTDDEIVAVHAYLTATPVAPQ
jgi:mono/diheme cytochrome c family protein